MKFNPQTFIMAAFMGAVVIGGYSCKTKPPVIEKPKVNEDSLRREQARLDSLRRLQEEADRLKREKEARERAQKEAYEKLAGAANRAAGASNVNDANMAVTEGLTLGATADVPVIIMILKAGNNDYDKPTTLRKYLEYCKDVKKNPYSVEKLTFDDNNKITSITLLKK